MRTVKVNQEVNATRPDGQMAKGKVIAISKDKVTVKFWDGKTVTIPVVELNAIF